MGPYRGARSNSSGLARYLISAAQSCSPKGPDERLQGLRRFSPPPARRCSPSGHSRSCDPRIAGMVVVIVNPAVPVCFGHQQGGLLDRLCRCSMRRIRWVRSARQKIRSRPGARPGHSRRSGPLKWRIRRCRRSGGSCRTGAGHVVEMELSNSLILRLRIRFTGRSSYSWASRCISGSFPELVDQLPVQHPDAQPLAQQGRQVMPAAAVFAANGDKDLLFSYENILSAPRQ